LRTLVKSTVVVLLIVSALIIVPPRLWVKNKKAKLTYNGHISEKIKLFHGQNGMILFLLPDQDSSGAFVYAPAYGLWHCGSGSFISLKLIAVSKRYPTGCAETRSGDEIRPVIAESQSIQFAMHDVPIVISWQAAPR
jgi:hypothetical protein